MTTRRACEPHPLTISTTYYVAAWFPKDAEYGGASHFPTEAKAMECRDSLIKCGYEAENVHVVKVTKERLA